MTDVFDIRILNFYFLTSKEYFFILGVIIFLVVFYLLLVLFLKNLPSKNIKVNNNIQKNPEKPYLVERFEYLQSHKEDFSREIFYREVGLFLRRAMFEIFDKEEIYTMTAMELGKKYVSKYLSVFLEVYAYEFDDSRVDTQESREFLLKKIKEIMD